jgi:hypothetical protein
MKRIILIVVLVTLALAFPWESLAQKQSRELSALMADKLTQSKLLLEGMAMNDFDKIDRAATKLTQLSRTEEWFVMKTPRYEVHSNEFRRATEQIVRKAKDRNLDGVALAYFDMTMTCIRCHEYVREVRDAKLDLPDRDGLGSHRDARGLAAVFP